MAGGRLATAEGARDAAVRVLHTSDWHAGKIWKGRSRHDELEAVLDDLAGAVERERVDLVLLSGDIFDGSSPPPEAERLVFGFFRRVGALGVPSVVIAGNHDSPQRVEAWGQLAELARVHALGVPRARTHGGLVVVEARNGERAHVGAVPFAPVNRLVSATQLGDHPDRAMRTYADAMARLLQHVSEGFDPQGVNLLMAHTHLEGALVAGSERRIHVGDDWAASPERLPSGVHYVALGHIHRAQRIAASPSPAYYAGSVMQLDFGEEGDTKTYNLVDARPRQPAHVQARPYVGARPLRTVTVTADSPSVDAATLADRPHVRVIVEADSRGVDPDLSRRVRAGIEGVVSVDLRLTAAARSAAAPALSRADATLSPRVLYDTFHKRMHGVAASDEVLATFDALYEQALAAETTE